MNTNWYYYLNSGYSHSWTEVSDFYIYMLSEAIIDANSPNSSYIELDGLGTYQYPPRVNGATIKPTFPGSLHNAFIVDFGTSTEPLQSHLEAQPLVNAHSTDRKHVTWRLLGINHQWADTKVSINRIKGDY